MTTSASSTILETTTMVRTVAAVTSASSSPHAEGGTSLPAVTGPLSGSAVPVAVAAERITLCL